MCGSGTERMAGSECCGFTLPRSRSRMGRAIQSRLPARRAAVCPRAACESIQRQLTRSQHHVRGPASGRVRCVPAVERGALCCVPWCRV